MLLSSVLVSFEQTFREMLSRQPESHIKKWIHEQHPVQIQRNALSISFAVLLRENMKSIVHVMHTISFISVDSFLDYSSECSYVLKLLE